jgi:aspartate carbamoyltransferase
MLPKPAFINGGDGKHEHPTQEFLDEYTFYENQKWKRDHIHIALIGDLFHGRTVHSKANGLRVFKEVEVDLVAPREIGMPRQYSDQMESNGFHIRVFGSIEEYLSQPRVAKIWYFTRLQLERMGEDVLEKRGMLQAAVTFKRDYLDRLPGDTKFYHPLPRNRENPTIPVFLDAMGLNGWEEQALNGYYTRIIELAMLGGKLGEDFEGKHPVALGFNDDFIEEANPVEHPTQEYKIGIKPIETGIVIDHIGKGDDAETIWDHIYKIRRILDLNMLSSHGVFKSDKTGKMKGMISLPDVDKDDFEEKKIKMLAAIAPGCTINFIKKSQVERKYRLHTPPRVYNFDEIGCTNPDCISHPSHNESVQTEFHRSCENIFTCKYCEKPHRFKEIWRI